MVDILMTDSGKRKGWWLLCGLLLLLVACHNGAKQPPEDTMRLGPPPAVADSIAPRQEVLPPEAPAPRESQALTERQDTAEATNLRLLARKQRTIYSPALLVGEWQRANEHEHYIADGTGSRWDTGDDLARDEAQTFRWTMDSNLLTFEYRTALGAVVPRQYVVTFVDDETLVYRDAYGSAYMWDKVPATFTDRP